MFANFLPLVRAKAHWRQVKATTAYACFPSVSSHRWVASLEVA